MKKFKIRHKHPVFAKALGLKKDQKEMHAINIEIAEEFVNPSRDPKKENKINMTHVIEDIIRSSRFIVGDDPDAPISKLEVMIAYRSMKMPRYIEIAQNRRAMLSINQAAKRLAEAFTVSFRLPDLELSAFKSAFQNSPKEETNDSKSEDTKSAKS